MTSGARFEHDDLADDEMILLTRAEFWFLRHAQLARAVASLGQSEYVWFGQYESIPSGFWVLVSGLQGF